MVEGRVVELWRWPVKSLGGERVERLRIDGRGAAGDRTHALYDVHRDAPRRLTARQSPRMLAWGASYGGADPAPDDPPPPTLTAPDGTAYAWDDPALPPALAQDLGRDVDLVRDVAGQQDLGDSLLITTVATHAAIERDYGHALDPRRWRTNVLVELGAPADAEEGWEGRGMTVGDAELVLLHPCGRCVIPTRDPDTQVKDGELLRWLTREHGGLHGINARPRGPATIGVGDQVVVA